LADFSAYPELAPSVIQVEVEKIDPDEQGRSRYRSGWEVHFRRGILRWVDMELLTGYWQIHAHEEGAEIEFDAQFDLGLPGLEDYLEPVAQRALEDNVREVLIRLFPGARVLDAVEAEL
jgi:hypothetical protein